MLSSVGILRGSRQCSISAILRAPRMPADRSPLWDLRFLGMSGGCFRSNSRLNSLISRSSSAVQGHATSPETHESSAVAIPLSLTSFPGANSATASRLDGKFDNALTYSSYNLVLNDVNVSTLAIVSHNPKWQSSEKS